MILFTIIFFKVWDEIEIEESLDTDKTYKSVIRVPMYCTPFIEELLFYSCQQINQALAHGLDKYDKISI